MAGNSSVTLFEPDRRFHAVYQGIAEFLGVEIGSWLETSKKIQVVDFDAKEAADAARFAIAHGGKQLFEREQNSKEHGDALATYAAFTDQAKAHMLDAQAELAAHAERTIAQSQASDLWLSSVGGTLRRDVVFALATMHWSYACTEYHFDLVTLVGVYANL